MKKFIKILLLVALAAPGIVIITFIVTAIALNVAGCERTLMLNTKFAPGFSKEAFKTISEGDTKAEVKARLGDPLDTQPYAGGERYFYSRQSLPGPCYISFHVYFDERGLVSGTQNLVWPWP